ncbi:MAG: TetR/AcrR family transcriptional regulator [Aeromicrobium sp.]
MSTDASEKSAPRRGRPGHDQETVMRRAIDVFNRRGYDGTSMEDLARELGFTKSAIYHHVPSKSHLLEAALNDGLGALGRVFDEARASDTEASAYERLRSAVTESVVVLVDHLPAVTLLLRVRGNSAIELDALSRRRKIDADLAALVRDAVDEGALRTDIDPDVISRLLFGMVNSLIEWYKPEGPQDAHTVARAVATLAFDGLTADRA